MKISKLIVKGFRGIDFESREGDLGQTLVLSGMNGTGKTTIIDAIYILLTKPRSGITQNYATSITSDTAELSIELDLTEEDIRYIAESILSSYPSLAFEVIIEELRSLFAGGKFIRILKIDKYGVNWRPERDIQEFLGSPEWSGDSPLIQQILSASSLCVRVDRLENLNINQILTLNTSYSLRQIVQAQHDEGQRHNKTSFDLSLVFSSEINKMLLAMVENEEDAVFETVSRMSAYFNQVLEPFKIGVDEAEYRRSGVMSLQLVSPVGFTYPITQASSGQKQAIALLSLVKAWSESAKPVVLMDEPEVGMHPDMITKVFRVVKKELSKSSNATCIIATHSTDLVKAYSENVFRLIRQEGRVCLEQIDNLDTRLKLLRELGVNFDLGYMVKRLIFTEGEYGSERTLNDAYIYQRLVDPSVEKILFRSGPSKLGAKSDLDPRARVFNNVIDAFMGDPSFHAWTIRDRDVDKPYDRPPRLRTPFRNIEYLFIANTNNLSNVLEGYGISLSSGQLESLFIQKDRQYQVSLIDVNAKPIWRDLRTKLVKEHQFDPGKFEELEKAIIEKLVLTNLSGLDKRVSEFFSTLKAIA